MDTSSFAIGPAVYGSTRHPFRASLPRRVLRRLPEPEPEVLRSQAGVDGLIAADAGPAPRRSVWRISVQDVKDFLIAYTACLLAVMTFLS